MPGLLSRILPREESFFDTFVELADNIHEGSKALVEMLSNFTNVPAQAERIKDLEHKEIGRAHV